MGNEEIAYFSRVVPANRIDHTDYNGRDFADHLAEEFMNTLFIKRRERNFRFCDIHFDDPDGMELDQTPDFIHVICRVATNGSACKKLLQYINDSIEYGFNIGTAEYVKLLARQIRDEYAKYIRSKETYRLEIEEDFRREEEKKILEKYSELIDKNVNKRMEKRDAKIKARRKK